MEKYADMGTSPSPSEENAAPPAAMVRIAETEEEITQAQKLRYQIFYTEYGATPSTTMQNEGRDFDEFDPYADHLIVLAPDKKTGKEIIVGTYRLLRQEKASELGRFYSDGEYNLDKLIKSGLTLLELGRSCVLADYRTKPILNLLWQGIASYITDHKLDIMFGCASFQGTDPQKIREQLSYLHHYHPTPENICPRAVSNRYVSMNLLKKEEIANPQRTFASLPPLIKGYLRLGATIGDGAVIDKEFNSIDVCIVVQTGNLSDRYRKHYERKIQKTMHSGTQLSNGVTNDSE